MLKTSGYIPSLDGWRAIAILLVIGFHDVVHKFGPFSTALLNTEGYRGVNLFFAISGILICSRLLEEERRFGKISLRGFYIRRVCRIQPAALLYLAVIGAMALAQRVPLTPGAFVSALLYVRNYYPPHGGIHDATVFTNHFWSLSVEEHFYLLFPLFLVLCVKHRAAILGTAAFCLAVWTSIVTVAPSLEFGPVVAWRTDVALDEILIPALLAILIANPNVQSALAKILHPWSAVLLAALLSVVAKFHVPAVSVVAAILFYPILLLGTILHPESWTARFLELPPLRFIGRISFSLYLWQQIIFTRSYTGPLPLGRFAVFPLNYAIVFSLAVLTYVFVEKPFIRLGHRWAPPASPGRVDAGV